jgi:hypothetical protein
MNRIRLLPLALAALIAAPLAQAAPDLVAVGTISGTYQDLDRATAGALENGVAGNRLGGLGSGLTWAGADTFLAVPDRGPNAVPFDSTVDDTVAYINRFETFRLALAPSDAGSALPLTLTPTLRATTLLSSSTPLVYGDLDGSGVPALNKANHTFYFTGRSDGFDPTKPSTNTNNARLDSESIRISNDGFSVFISDEYGPYIYQFDRFSGQRIKAFKLPANLAVTNLSPNSATEISGNTSGRIANKGMEGLAITPDGRTLVGVMQEALIQDGGDNGPYTRIVTVDIRTGATHQYAYPLTNTGTVSKPKFPTVSDLTAINDHQFLVDERDGHGRADQSQAKFKQLNIIDLDGAHDVSNLSGAANLAPLALSKTLFLDIVADLGTHGFASDQVPAKLEGISFGPDVVVNGTKMHTLYVSNDNDFLATTTDDHAATMDNPNQFFVFAFTDADLPGLVPQPVTALIGVECNEDGFMGGDDHGGKDRFQEIH